MTRPVTLTAEQREWVARIRTKMAVSSDRHIRDAEPILTDIQLVWLRELLNDPN